MIELITDRPAKWKDYLASRMNAIDEEGVTPVRMLIITETDNEDISYLIDFLNCTNYDILHLIEVARVETYRHEILGDSEDEYIEDDEGDYDEYFTV